MFRTDLSSWPKILQCLLYMELDQKTTLLAQTELLGQVDPAILPHLATRATPRRYQQGHFIFHQGDDGGSLVVVASGAVRLETRTGDGRRLVLRVVRPPGSFGEITVLDGGPRTAGAEVLTETTALVLTRKDLFDVLREQPPLAQHLLVQLAGNLRAMSEMVRDFALRDLTARVANLLVQAVDPDAGPGTVFSLREPRRTQQDLADAVGCARPSINKILHSFQELGWISLEPTQIVLLQPDRLRERAG